MDALLDRLPSLIDTIRSGIALRERIIEDADTGAVPVNAQTLERTRDILVADRRALEAAALALIAR